MKWKLSTSELLWWGFTFMVLGYLLTGLSVMVIFGEAVVENVVPPFWRPVLFIPLIIVGIWSRMMPGETFERVEDAA